MIKRAHNQSSDNFDLGDRSVAEELWLWRHRQQSDAGAARGRRAGSMGLPEAAERLGINASQLQKLEHGDAVLVNADELSEMIDWEIWQEIDEHEPGLGELCFLARRRSGTPIKDAAAALGVTTTTYAKWEMEGDERVVYLWFKRGYRFPHLPAPPVAAPPAPAGRVFITRPTQ